mmetsp:Transcript_14370/g.23783  ORF Transcript_14370/g.23783 Transcript_14370/m.23783 type:complete len:820 (+) Transcript_14370:54-2513(+)
MLIRLRSNLGMWKLNIDDGNMSVGDLKKKIFTDFKFLPEFVPCDILLSATMTTESGNDGPETFSDPSTTLNQLDIKHGCMVYIVSKLNQTVIEKSYVGEDGNMVEAGTKISIEGAPSTAKGPSSGSIMSTTTLSSPSINSVPVNPTGTQTSRGLSSSSKQGGADNEVRTMTDEEAIAKLMEEDLKLAAASGGANDQDREFSSPTVRAPDATKNIRLFDPQPDYDDDDVSPFGLGLRGRGLNHLEEVSTLMSQFLDPQAEISAAARHGRPPLRDLSSTRPTAPPIQHSEFDAPVMNQEVLENARAAGLTEKEIREMFDAEYSEMLQANVISNDLKNEANDSDYIPVVEDVTEGLHGTRGKIGNNHDFPEDLTELTTGANYMHDHHEQEINDLAKNMTPLSTGSPPGQYRLNSDTDYVSAEEERLIQEIMASSLAEAESLKSVVTGSGTGGTDVKCSDLPLFQSSAQAGASKIGCDGTGSDGVVDLTLDSRTGRGATSKVNVKRTEPSKPSTAQFHTRGSKSRSSDRPRQTNEHAPQGLSLEGRRMGVERDPPTTDRKSVRKKDLSKHSTASHFAHNDGTDMNTATDESSTFFPHPVSGVSVQRSVRPSQVRSTACQGVVENQTNGSGAVSNSEVLNDSMDDEVMAWALKMSVEDTGAASRSDSSDSNRSSAQTQLKSSSHRNTDSSSRFRMKPEAKAEMRSAASEKAEKLLQRLNAELDKEEPSATGLRPITTTATATKAMSGLPNSISRFRSDFNEGGTTGNSVTSNRVSGRYDVAPPVAQSTRIGNTDQRTDDRNTNIDVSTMDEDEQLAWALQQSML